MPKLLFIQYRPFSSVMNGGEQGTKRNLDALYQVCGQNNVDIYYIHKQTKSSLMDYIKGVLYLPFGYFFGLTPAKVKEIVRLSSQYDFIFIDRSIFGIIAKALQEANYRGKTIAFFQNVETLYMDAKLQKYMPFRNVFIRCADKNDEWSCRFSNKIIVLNERDKQQIATLYHKEADGIIPVTLKDKCDPSAMNTGKLTSKHPACLFLGAYFLANNEGILWFLQNVYPHVNIEVKIVGRGMAKLKAEQPKLLNNIEVVSDAPDLLPYLQWADMMVLPIFSGSGMKVKTCESLMYGKNILGTNEAFEGYRIAEGVSGWRCNTAEEYIACINDFAAHPYPKWNKNARQCYLDYYSDKAVEKIFKGLLN